MALGELNNRARKILHALVSEYIATGEPVGSRTLSRKYDLQLSPASIRNVMSDLEELGYLRAPHTSAGRVPTERGFRFFVDCLVKVRDLSAAERERIQEAYDPLQRDGLEVGQIMRETSRLLSELSHHAGVVLAPRPSVATFEHIEFVRLSGDRLLAILVGSGGLVQNRLLHVPSPPAQPELERYANYLNALLTGLTLAEVREKVLVEMGREKNAYDALVSRALELGTAVLTPPLDDVDEQPLYLSGQARLFDAPEFGDVAKMKALLKAFEDKQQIIRLLDITAEAKGIQIFIGAEAPHLEIEDCAVVAKAYGAGEPGAGTLGVIGVIGPARMNYSRVIPLVDCTARIVTSMLERGR